MLENKQGSLHLYSYISKQGNHYIMTYYAGKFRFVHITTEKGRTCIKGTNKKGKPFLLYTGDFILDEESNAIIIK